MVSLSVVIPTFNRKEKLKRLLESLKQSTYTDFEIIVVDDASSDETDALMRSSFSDVRYLRHNKIELVGKSRNDGILASAANLVLMIDDDNTIDPHAIEILMRFAQSNGDCGVIAPVTCFYDRPDVIMYAGSRFHRITKKTEFLHSGEDRSSVKGRTFETDGFANSFMLRRDLAIGAGLTTPKIPFSGEDGYLQLKIKKMGYRLVCIGDALVFHDAPNNRMFMRATPFRLYYFMRGKLTFERELDSGTGILLFSAFIPAFFLWYFFTSMKGENKLACMRSVILGAFDGLFSRYPLRYV